MTPMAFSTTFTKTSIGIGIKRYVSIFETLLAFELTDYFKERGLQP